MCHNNQWLAIMAHCHVQLDRATAHLAILDVTLVLDGAVDKNINGLATIRAMDFSRLNLVHRIKNSQGLHTGIRPPGEISKLGCSSAQQFDQGLRHRFG